MDRPKTPRRKRLRGGHRLYVGAGVTPELYEAIRADAEAKGTTVSAHSAEILAEHFGIPA